MRDSMKHGGPDDEGIYIDEKLPLALGHRRLSLIDLSAAGHQPMQDLHGNVQLIFNGEIYNFQELREQLEALGHQFRTGTDTEVIIYAYLQWGTACFEKFNGMFAIVLFDAQKSRLVMARDHAGIKPLYFSLTNNALFFASEVRAFKALDPQWPENESWKIHLLTFGHLPEPITTLQNVHPLQKGTFAIIELPSLKITHQVFCEFRFESIITDERIAVSLIKEKLENAVERHLISDAPIGLFLSGGIDSSLLTLLAHRTLKQNLHTLSIVFDDKKYSEEYFQKIIIDQTGANHKSYLVTDEEFYAAVPDILAAMDQPSTDGINTYFICKYARQAGLTAVLSGLGADEIFGGYDSFYRTDKIKYLRLLPSIVLNGAAGLANDKFKKLAFLNKKSFLGDYLVNRGFYTPSQTAELLGCSVREVNATIDKITLPRLTSNQDRQDIVSAGEQHLYMQNQLLKDTDYMSMWHSVEVRVPFLDKELLQAAHQVSPSIKYDVNLKKSLLIKAFQDILPKEIYQRKKQGFTFPFQTWISRVQTSNRRDAHFIALLAKLKKGKLQWSRYWSYLLAVQSKAIRHYAVDPKRVLFLNLNAFSITGGIEKFNRSFLKALNDIEQEGDLVADAMSVYDSSTADAKYFTGKYTGYNGNRVAFVIDAIKASRDYDIIIFGHINLALAGVPIKKLYPGKKVVLIAHGIEVWQKLKGAKAAFLREVDTVLAVSNFTKDTMVVVQGLPAEKIRIFHNTIDPYFRYPTDFQKPKYLVKRYGLHDDDKVLFTLTRLSYTEKYKGYDQVMELVPVLRSEHSNLKYILGGKPDVREQKRVNEIIGENDLSDNMVLTGFIKDEEVMDHYLLSDVFVMPSRKEGFGIVFIEAMACGLPVIAGNIDGSVDALKNGELGTLVNPASKTEILQGIRASLNNGHSLSGAALQAKAKEAFGFEVYKERLEEILEQI